MASNKVMVLLALAATLWLGAPDARADDTDARIARLEQLLAAQAQQIEALRRQVAAQAPAPGVGATPPGPDVGMAAPPALASPPPPPPPRVTDLVPATPAATSTGRLASPWTTPPATEVAPRLVRAPAPSGLVTPGVPGGPNLHWGGYLTLEYVANSTRNSYFDLHRLILQLDADVTDHVDLTAELEFEHGGIGGGRTGDVEVEQVAVNWRLCDALRLVFGAPLVPFGRFNAEHDDPLNDFTKRPLTGRYLVPTGFGQPGVGLGGAVPLGSGSLSYDVLVTSGFSDDFTADGGVRGGRQAWDEDNNESKQLWGRTVFRSSGRLVDRLELGLSGTWSRYDDESRNDLFGYGLDWLLRKGPIELRGEFLSYDIERDPSDAPTSVRGQRGVWAEVAWHFFPPAWRCRCGPLLTDTSLFTLAFRYQHLDLDDRRTGAAFNDDLDAYGFAFNYRLTERSVFRVDYTLFDAETADDESELTFSFSTYF